MSVPDESPSQLILICQNVLPNLELFGQTNGPQNDDRQDQKDSELEVQQSVRTTSFKWCEEYSNEIISTLKETEMFRKKLNFASPQLNHRCNLLVLLEIASTMMELSLTTKYLAVYYLDSFMDAYKVPDEKLDLIAITCLLLASKIEDVDSKVPKINTLNCYLKYKYEKATYCYVERSIIKYFSWDLMHPTAATYINLYNGSLIDDVDVLPYEDIQRLKVFAGHELFEYLNSTLYDIRLVNEPPSMIAAGCLFATRKMLNIKPCWPDRLKNLTGYSRNVFREFALAIIEQRRQLKAYYEEAHTPDSGFSDWISNESDNDNMDLSSVDNEDSSSEGEDGAELVRNYFREPKRSRYI